MFVCFWFEQISLSVTEELHIINFDTVFDLKGLSVELQVQFSAFMFCYMAGINNYVI